MPVESNIAVRKAADTLLALCEDEAAGMSPDGAKRFWTLLEYRCAEKSGFDTTAKGKAIPQKMTDEQARLFGLAPMPWGKYAGTSVKDVPLSYLAFIAEQRDDFKEMLQRYLRNDRIQAEIDEPPAD